MLEGEREFTRALVCAHAGYITSSWPAAEQTLATGVFKLLFENFLVACCCCCLPLCLSSTEKMCPVQKMQRIYIYISSHVLYTYRYIYSPIGTYISLQCFARAVASERDTGLPARAFISGLCTEFWQKKLAWTACGSDERAIIYT